MSENIDLQHSRNELDEDYERAAEWLDLMADGNMDELAQRRFSLWFNGGENRREIFERMSATWNSDALRCVAEEQAKKLSPASRKKAEGIHLSLRPMALALCVGAFLGVFGFYFIAANITSSTSHLMTNSSFNTTASQNKNYQLVDGSNVELSPKTQLDIHFSAGRRNLELKQGAAYFEVAHDKARPFDVHIGTVSVVAVGTQFTIDKSNNAVDVIVYEGVVDVRKDSSSDLKRLHAGASAHIENNNISIGKVDLLRLSDWRSGWMELQNESLGFLVEHLNRYSTLPIVVKNNEINSIRIAGRFKLDSPEKTIAMVANLYQLNTQMRNGQLEVSQEKNQH